VLLVLPGRLPLAELVGGAELVGQAVLLVRADLLGGAGAGPATLAGGPVERFPGAIPAHQQALRQGVLATGHEHALDAPTRLLQPRHGLRPGDDDDVARWHTHDQVARHHALQAGPKIAGEKQARFETLEGEHQRGRLTVELGAGGQNFEMLERGATQYARGHLHLIKIGMRYDTPSELWAVGVDDGKVRRVLIPHGTGVYSVRITRGEEGNKRGTGHLHLGNLTADGRNAKP
jgi:hypothetical protein